jgi:hypothetical protein
MASVTLIHPEATVAISIVQAIQKCSLFQNNPTLATVPYRVQSSVPLLIFQEFVSALEDKEVNITNTNFRGLERLCTEFGFHDFSAKLSHFRPSIDIEGSSERYTHIRIAGLEEKAEQHDRDIVVLQSELQQLSTHIVSLADEVASLHLSLQKQHAVQLCTELGEQRSEFSIEKMQIAGIPSTSIPSIQNFPSLSSPAAVQPSVLSTRFLDSQIISEIPDIFTEFRLKQFSLLWRGSRDGFEEEAFHGLCDDRANTLTIILDTNGNIFGGFTPVKWESLKSVYKADDSQRSFLFTLKNPQNIPAKIFELKVERKDRAIYCNSERCPCFWNDLYISDHCNSQNGSYTQLGDSYRNDTVFDGKTIFAGSRYFQVREIEVFHITD